MGYHTTKDTIENCPRGVQNSEFQILLTLAALVDDKTRGWWIHIQHLADLAHMSRSTAIRSMQVLCDLGVIIRHRENRKKPYTYRIVEYDKVGQETSTFLGEETFHVESPEPLEPPKVKDGSEESAVSRSPADASGRRTIVGFDPLNIDPQRDPGRASTISSQMLPQAEPTSTPKPAARPQMVRHYFHKWTFEKGVGAVCSNCGVKDGPGGCWHIPCERKDEKLTAKEIAQLLGAEVSA
jgi:predicted transcriptional regulator